jgi:hypothetical protein
MDDGRFSDQEVRQGLADSAGQVRASDVERENALRALAAHFADGRLDRAEFDERADVALAARTQSQLHALFADLPGPAPAPVALPDAGAPPASAALRRVRRGVAVSGVPLVPLVPVLLVLAVMAAVHGLPPFPLIPLLFILSRRHRRWNREARPWI